ncbi:MAG: bifunctional DNA primase/polymerase, partial [Planctomycetales bacterium]|nr:bifunctional DNA primase/polymerase [Planctomycetales bacterium]
MTGTRLPLTEGEGEGMLNPGIITQHKLSVQYNGVTATTGVLDAAREYRRRNWYSVPLERGEKFPRRSDWSRLRILESELEHYFADAAGIGLLTGPASGGVVDVDLDADMTRRFADRFLPPTGAVFGRATAPASHRLYVCRDMVEK